MLSPEASNSMWRCFEVFFSSVDHNCQPSVGRGQQYRRTRYCSVSRLPLPKPERHPKSEDAENRSNTAEDHGTDVADTPLRALMSVE